MYHPDIPVPHILIFFETRRLNLVWSQKHIKFSILWIANQIFSFLLNEYCFWRSFQNFIRGCLFHCRWIVLKESHTFWNLQRAEEICITVFYWIINFEHILKKKCNTARNVAKTICCHYTNTTVYFVKNIFLYVGLSLSEETQERETLTYFLRAPLKLILFYHLFFHIYSLIERQN